MGESAARFFRVSSDGQDEENQIADVDKHIADHGYTVARTFTLHDVSASKGEHESELAEILTDIKAGLYTVVVIANSARIDRRDVDTQQLFTIMVRMAGGRIESAREPEFGADSLSGRMMTMLAQQGNYDYTATLKKNVNASFARIDANGAIRGKALYGYAITGVKYVKTFEIIDSEAELIRDAVRWYLDGMTLAMICRKLNNAGRLTRPVKHKGITKARDWSPKTLGQVLRSETLIGRRHQGDSIVSVPAIVTVRDWEAVQAKLDTKAYRKGVRTHQDTAFLTSLAVCGKCGRNLYKTVGGYGKSRGPYYYCRPATPVKDGGVSCQIMIPMAVLDESMSEFMLSFIKDAGTWTREVEVPGHDWSNEIALKSLAIDDLKLRDFPSRKDFMARQAELMAELDDLESRPDAEPTTKVVEYTWQEFAEQWNAMNRSEQREALISREAKVNVFSRQVAIVTFGGQEAGPLVMLDKPLMSVVSE